MATVSELKNTPLSGLNHIDALLDIGPDWNYMIGVTPKTIYYTFSIASGNEVNPDTGVMVTGQAAFTAGQQQATRGAFTYLQQITGIQFVETSVGTNAQIHLANLDLDGQLTTGLCSWNAPYSYIGDNVVGYKPDAYVYLDHIDWGAKQNYDLTPGGKGYETLLHELGHALGLKHPFEDATRLPTGQDNTGNTIMSYTEAGGPYSTFSPYDIAALNWLYGGDGLGGALGVDAEGRFITGTTGADRITGTAGNDRIVVLGGNDIADGGGGTDTVVFSRGRGEYSFSENAGGSLLATHATLGTVTLTNIELLAFTDGQYQRSQLTNDTVAPPAPVLTVRKNAADYLPTGATPVFTGQVEPNSVVRVYYNDQVVAEAPTDASGVFSIVGSSFPNGRGYSVYATATDSAGNVSVRSAPLSFNVDATAPVTPTSSVALGSGENQPVFSGTAEAGTTIQLVRTSDLVEIGRTVASSDGTWKIDSATLPNGNYDVVAASVDIAGNASTAATLLQFTINSALNLSGDGGNNRFTPGAGNNAVDGMGGIDTVAYAGASSNFTVARGIYGVTVTDKSGALGADNLINVERVQFSDGWKAIDVDGIGGQVYRLYEAVFGRPSDKTGMGYWIDRMEKGTSLLQVSKEFITNQPEFDKLYGAKPSDGEFLTKLYENILDRAPDAAGYAYWVGRIVDSSREQILMEFSEGFENQAQVIGSISGGIDYTPWTGA
ncbi:MAG: DUF4214 domain-containing protein [Massilia sp.]|nr:MAG: DUF4214 domain-containing protein [Massilia sp.]